MSDTNTMELEIMTIGGINCYEQDGMVYLNLEAVARGLGIKAGLSSATIYKILDNGYCTTKTMHKIAKALKTPVFTLTNTEEQE